MNALVSLDSILEPSEPSQALTATSLFGSGQVESILSAIEKDVRAELFEIETSEGRERVKSVAYKIARSKTTLDEIGKEHVAHIKAQSTAIDKERKTLRDRLDALKDEVRGPLTAWETAEDDRIAGHEGALVWLAECTRFATSPTVAMIQAQIVDAVQLTDRDWQEFKERGDASTKEAIANLDAMLQAAKKTEADAAELADLRRLKAEREEADRKADAERIAAQQAAGRQAYEERREKERAEKAERDKAAAVAAAIETERKRQEAEADRAAADKAREEAAERKRQENKKHRAKVHNEICADLIAAGVPNDVELVQGIVKALAAGSVRHLSITY